MPAILTLTTPDGQTIYTCEVDYVVNVTAEANTAAVINQYLANVPAVNMTVVGNTIPAANPNTMMNSSLQFDQFDLIPGVTVNNQLIVNAK